MHNSRFIAAAVVASLALSPLSGFAQQPAPADPPAALQQPAPTEPQPSVQQPSEPKASVAQGQIVRVDSTTRTITIKTATEPQMRFLYTDSTAVVGAGESVAGLATLSGVDVSVKYTTRGADRVATEISILKPKA